ncbi:GNAT family N-acetyltransferase [Paenibacillus sp. YN15]|uniref:GNAT family N-acetyltransferase n=1 Tax=Paenibacillus sp. YN15 TaxID=1742774 RepID=UPI0015ECD375|nr:GNAT family N-acetyltransferase [Paenibacillus sp. YN15]
MRTLIREAEGRDQEQLSRLYRMLVPNSKKMNVQAEQIGKIRTDPMNFIFVYEEQGELLGSLTLNICMQALHGEQPYAIVENVIVHEDHRSKNIGQQLFRHVEEYCNSIHCHRIMLLSKATRIRAHRFFEREGYDGQVSKGFKKYL